jgi:hypothetical protein
VDTALRSNGGRLESSKTRPPVPRIGGPHARTGDCFLLDFVPKQSRHEAIPCRHISLNESSETLDTLYRTATNEEIEQSLREWLLKTIAGLEETILAEMPWRGEKAG